jgi:hypothetical protein
MGVFADVWSRNYGWQTSNVTTHPMNVPDDLYVDDLLLALFGFDGNPTATASAGTPGWTRLFNVPNGDGTLALFAKLVTATGNALTVTTSASESSAHMAWSIYNWKGALSDVYWATAVGQSATADPPNLTPAGGVQKYLWLAGCTGAWGSFMPTAGPSNMANFFAAQAGTASNHGCIARSEVFSETSSFNPNTFTSSESREWVACTIAIAGDPNKSLTDEGAMLAFI